MTAQDFRTIAYVLKENRERSTPVEAWRCDEIARTFASELAVLNPRFDREKFLAAAGVEAASSQCASCRCS